jgi:hypothetical protein
MTVEPGKNVSVEFDGDSPNDINAYLVDYDSDVTETYPLKKINDDTF